MGLRDRILMRAFGRPKGILGWIGGKLMARGKTEFGTWLIEEADLTTDCDVLDVGCGPGFLLELLAVANMRSVTGMDPSRVMLNQAQRRMKRSSATQFVQVVGAEAEAMPFADATFDAVFAVNSYQLWRAPSQGLWQCLRILRPGGQLCLGFTPESGQEVLVLEKAVVQAGFGVPELVSGEGGFRVLAGKRSRTT